MGGEAFSASKMEPCRCPGYCSKSWMHRQLLNGCNAAAEPFATCRRRLYDDAAQLRPFSRLKSALGAMLHRSFCPNLPVLGCFAHQTLLLPCVYALALSLWRLSRCVLRCVQTGKRVLTTVKQVQRCRWATHVLRETFE